ncbi:MAG: hypothetical protein QNJ84_17760, partial [Alphaproteobacteria bacterium]|nr:hypothetical protein [Alphaproteobacteria bacterium]
MKLTIEGSRHLTDAVSGVDRLGVAPGQRHRHRPDKARKFGVTPWVVAERAADKLLQARPHRARETVLRRRLTHCAARRRMRQDLGDIAFGDRPKRTVKPFQIAYRLKQRRRGQRD